MTLKENRPPVEGQGAVEVNRPRAEDEFPTTLPRPADFEAYRRRRARPLSCRRTEDHLRRHGLWGALSETVLDEIARWSA